MLIRSILAAAGYEVVVAADGLQALTLLQQSGPVDLVVTDVEMPGMNGFELTEAIRGGACGSPRWCCDLARGW